MYRNDEDLVKDLQGLANVKPRAAFARQLEDRLLKEARKPWWSRYRLLTSGIAAVAVLVMLLTASLTDSSEVRGTPVTNAHTGLVAYTVFQNEKSELHLADPETMTTEKTIELLDAPSTKIFEDNSGRLWIPALGKFPSSKENRVLVVDPKTGTRNILTVGKGPDSVFFQNGTAYIVCLGEYQKIVIYEAGEDLKPKLFKTIAVEGFAREATFRDAQFRFFIQAHAEGVIKTLTVPLSGNPVLRNLWEPQKGFTYVFGSENHVQLVLADGTHSKFVSLDPRTFEKMDQFEIGSVRNPIGIDFYTSKAVLSDQHLVAFIGVPKGQEQTHVILIDTITGDIIRRFPTKYPAMNLTYDNERWYVQSKDTVEVFTFDGTPVTSLHPDGLISNFVLN